jgi:WD40 repeat protein
VQQRVFTTAIVLSADGKLLAVNGFDEGRQQYVTYVQTWDPTTGKPLATLDAHVGLLGLFLSPEGKSMALLGPRHLGGTPSVTRLDAANGRVQAALTFDEYKESPRSLAFSPDGQLIALGCYDGRVRLWRMAPAEAK